MSEVHETLDSLQNLHGITVTNLCRCRTLLGVLLVLLARACSWVTVTTCSYHALCTDIAQHAQVARKTAVLVCPQQQCLIGNFQTAAIVCKMSCVSAHLRALLVSGLLPMLRRSSASSTPSRSPSSFSTASLVAMNLGFSPAAVAHGPCNIP